MDKAATATITFKSKHTRAARWLRAVSSFADPRAYFHMLRMVHHYNTTHVVPRRSISCGPNPAISPTAQFANPKGIHLGARPHIGSNCILWAGPGHGRIVVGNDLLLGPNVLITAANYRFRDGSPVTDQAMQEQDVRIGHDVWIGAGAIILPGARIGDGVVVAAGSVVCGTVEAMSVVAGTPARVIGQR